MKSFFVFSVFAVLFVGINTGFIGTDTGLRNIRETEPEKPNFGDLYKLRNVSETDPKKAISAYEVGGKKYNVEVAALNMSPEMQGELVKTSVEAIDKSKGIRELAKNIAQEMDSKYGGKKPWNVVVGSENLGVYVDTRHGYYMLFKVRQRSILAFKALN